MMKEGAGGDLEQYDVVLPPHVEPVQRLQRAFRLAVGGAEGGEVMPSDQQLCRLVHGFGVERHRDPPRPPRLQRQRCPAVDDAIHIAPTDAAEAGMEILCRLFGFQDRHRLRPQFRVEPVQ